MNSDETRPMGEPTRQEVLTGERADGMIRQVLETTALGDLDAYLRERGFEHADGDVRRGVHPDQPYDLYWANRHYESDDGRAAATFWMGLDPAKLADGTLSYDLIELPDDVDLPDDVGDSLYPIVGGVYLHEPIGLNPTPDGIEENEIDVGGLEEMLEGGGLELEQCESDPNE